MSYKEETKNPLKDKLTIKKTKPSIKRIRFILNKRLIIANHKRIKRTKSDSNKLNIKHETEKVFLDMAGLKSTKINVNLKQKH